MDLSSIKKQKAEELEIIKKFISILRKNTGNEIKLLEENRDSPDFILSINGSTEGFELSEIIEGKENIALNTSIKINTMLAESIKEDSKYNFLNKKAINIQGFNNKSLNQKIFSPIINQIEQFLLLKENEIGDRKVFFNKDFDKNFKLLKRKIKKITIFSIDTEESMIEISNRQVFSYSIEKDILKNIEVKNKKLLEYKNRDQIGLKSYSILFYIKNSSLYKLQTEISKAIDILRKNRKDIDFNQVYLFDFNGNTTTIISN